MLNFTVGPVMSSDEVLRIGGQQVPYFRTPEFSELMLENEQRMNRFACAPKGSRTVFLTASGSGAMEAAVMNLFTEKDKVLVINGGSFGQRFEDLCGIHKIPAEIIHLQAGEALTAEHLQSYEGKGFTGFLVNIHETSTGVHYDLDLISEFCRRNRLFLLVDAISSFLADPLDMSRSGIGAMITGSQKALACAPGISIIVLSPAAIERIECNEVRSLYFNLSSALKNGERGQTPFTPAVGTLRQIHERLRNIDMAGGVEQEVARVAALAEDFRSRISHLPFSSVTTSPSNAVTALHPREGVSAHDIFSIIKDRYHIWICPNGGAWRDTIFRVGHIGSLTPADNTTLIRCFDEMLAKGEL